jgi:hypothetical protein
MTSLCWAIEITPNFGLVPYIGKLLLDVSTHILDCQPPNLGVLAVLLDKRRAFGRLASCRRMAGPTGTPEGTSSALRLPIEPQAAALNGRFKRLRSGREVETNGGGALRAAMDCVSAASIARRRRPPKFKNAQTSRAGRRPAPQPGMTLWCRRLACNVKAPSPSIPLPAGERGIIFCSLPRAALARLTGPGL